MTTLTHEYIRHLISTNKQRGVYFGFIDAHVESGELATNISEEPYCKGMDYLSVRQSMNQNIEKKSAENDWPALTVLTDKVDPKDKSTWQVILVNMDVLVAEAAEAGVDEAELVNLLGSDDDDEVAA